MKEFDKFPDEAIELSLQRYISNAARRNLGVFTVRRRYQCSEPDISMVYHRQTGGWYRVELISSSGNVRRLWWYEGRWKM